MPATSPATLVDDRRGEAASVRPAQVHPQQHRRPVLRLGAAGARLDVEERAARVHLARKHARQLELAHAPVEARRVLDDLAETRLVALGLDQGKQFGSVREPGRQLVEFRGDGFEPRTLAPEGLGLVRRIPDRRIAQLVIQLFEALTLRVILKGTPSAPAGAP